MNTALSPTPLSRELLTIQQVAERWDVSRDLVELAIKQGHLKCLRLSPRNIRVAPRALGWSVERRVHRTTCGRGRQSETINEAAAA